MAALLPALTGCAWLGAGPGPEEVARDFLNQLASGGTEAASRLTDDPDAAKKVLDQVRGALNPTGVSLSLDEVREQDGDQPTATGAFTARWDLGHGRVWNYQGEVGLRTGERGWQVRWAPSVVHPRLGNAQIIALRELTPDIAPVLDRDGVPLLSAENVVSVLLNRAKAGDLGQVSAALAGALARFDASITAESISAGAAGTADGTDYLVVSLREADYQQVKPAIYDLPGVRFTTQRRLLGADRDFGSQVLPALRATAEQRTEGRAGFQINTVNTGTGETVDELHAEPARPAEALTTTLSQPVQAAAEAAVDPATQPAALVAMRASTGELLAVAQNAPADQQGALALSGRFPPGSTFKIATTVAALEAGLATGDSPQPCPGATVIANRRIPNDNEFDKGTIPLRTAFALSCNTTFAQLAANLPETALTEAAAKLGLGVDFVVTGATTVTGSVPPAGDVVERAEDGFGQGKVLASPFGMALVAATVAAGTMPTPTLLRGQTTQVSARPQAIAPAILDQVRQMMRDVVTDGTARILADLPDVAGKTGTAQFGDGSNAHGWFVGYRGDVAVAVLLVGSGTSGPAVEAASRFLHALP
ncbi:penicillin-binding transpeptidase domain-containing protein [Goodfellowiella coeruleoviolacea]|uniref:penicillin-binding transpeptidase domain-containing protein n=1 Tax=Goodfellowiella coeruleoviolacea TaxID=334858 RepID=UPI0020A600DA|nr:penicillin-binding transpeptidase domain-containing protein [Goodfellowiella coeruleoviolacea]